jgi:hypothetical protein
MGKTLLEIIEQVKDAGRPDYEDLRYALLATDALRHYDHHAVIRLWQRELGGKYRADLFGLKHEVDESFRRTKAFMAKPPKDVVGSANDPDNPEYQRMRRTAFKVLEKVLEKATAKGL